MPSNGRPLEDEEEENITELHNLSYLFKLLHGLNEYYYYFYSMAYNI
jgi:hypothetical protein